MAEAAKLGARDFVDADLVGLEMERDLHAGPDVLFHAQLADEEIVDDVAGVHDEADRTADGNLDGCANDVVLASGVLVIEAVGIAGGIVDELEIGAAELAVWPGVAEVPGELFG